MPWIRNTPSHKPSTAPHPHLAILTVIQPMNPDYRSWNHALVTSLFSPQDVVAITSIPLFNRPFIDRRIWLATTEGEYSVKSAYRWCAELLDSPAHAAPLWQLIWKLKIPPKARSLLWRVGQKCLPTRSNLLSRGIPCDDSCVVCDTLAETHMHLFFICDKAKECWESIDLGNLLCELIPQADDFFTFLSVFLGRLSTHQQHLAAMTLWSLWKSRNTKFWEHSGTTSATTVSRAKDTLHEWSCMQKEKPQVQSAQQHPSWSKPPQGSLKCNVDAALFDNNAVAGLGLCFRNSDGHLLLGMSDFSNYTMSPLEAEATDLLAAINLAVQFGFQVVQFETYNKTLADAIYSSSSNLNEFGDFISQCRQLFLLYPNFSVSFIRRQANSVAHSIARASYSNTSPHIFSIVPDYLYSLCLC